MQGAQPETLNGKAPAADPALSQCDITSWALDVHEHTPPDCETEGLRVTTGGGTPMSPLSGVDPPSPPRGRALCVLPCDSPAAARARPESEGSSNIVSPPLQQLKTLAVHVPDGPEEPEGDVPEPEGTPLSLQQRRRAALNGAAAAADGAAAARPRAPEGNVGVEWSRRDSLGAQGTGWTAPAAPNGGYNEAPARGAAGNAGDVPGGDGGPGAGAPDAASAPGGPVPDGPPAPRAADGPPAAPRAAGAGVAGAGALPQPRRPPQGARADPRGAAAAVRPLPARTRALPATGAAAVAADPPQPPAAGALARSCAAAPRARPAPRPVLAPAPVDPHLREAGRQHQHRPQRPPAAAAAAGAGPTAHHRPRGGQPPAPPCRRALPHDAGRPGVQGPAGRAAAAVAQRVRAGGGGRARRRPRRPPAPVPLRRSGGAAARHGPVAAARECARPPPRHRVTEARAPQPPALGLCPPARPLCGAEDGRRWSAGMPHNPHHRWRRPKC